jgi:dCTP diphosphatase
MTPLSTLDAQMEFAAFRDERGWAPFHDPRSLALALCSEAGELAGRLAWCGADEDLDGATRAAAAAELADVVCFALHLANALDVDLGAEVGQAFATTRERFASLPAGTPSRKVEEAS